MKRFIVIAFSIIIGLISCDNLVTKKAGEFQKSFKEKSEYSFYKYLDSSTNIYSNFYYHVSFDAPNNWTTDAGVSEHTIFRAFHRDSSLTFSLNVIELNYGKNEEISNVNIWELYQNNQKKLDYPIIALIEKQYNTKVSNFEVIKSYIKGNIALKRTLNYNVRDLDIIYNMKNISYQVMTNRFTFTFTLSVPTMFYNNKPSYFDNMFRNIYFLKDTETLENFMEQMDIR
jgi:hypothetical protein